MPNFKICLMRGPGSPRNWEGSFAIAPGATLEDVHLLIQDAVQFDDDHGYEFYIARTHSSRAKDVFDDENGELYQRTLASLLPLPAKHALFYPTTGSSRSSPRAAQHLRRWAARWSPA
jgi:hypothetical protein